MARCVLLPLLLLVAVPATAQTPVKPVLHCTLAQCTARALSRSPFLAAARLGVDQYQSKLREAHSVFYPKLEVNGFASVLPALKPGHDGSKPMDDYDFTRLGPLGVGSIGIAQTLSTFGKVNTLQELAEKGIDIARTTVRVAEDEMRYQLARAWWGLVLVADLRSLTDDVRRLLDETRTKLDKQRDEGDAAFNQNDLLKLNVYAAEIEEKLRTFARNREQALDGLRLAMGDDAAQDIVPAGELTAVVVPAMPIEAAEQLAVANAPRLVAQRGGVQARLLQVDAAQANWWPDLLFVARVAGTYAPTRDENSDSLATNPSNTATTGLGVVLRWTLDIWRQLERVEQAELDLRQAQLAIAGETARTRTDARQLFREMMDAHAMIGIQDKAHRAARGLLTAETQAYDDGFGDFTEVLRAMESYTRRRLAFAEAMFTYNVAVAALSRQVGMDLTTLQRVL